VMIGMGYIGSNKEHMLLNVNKENRLYSVKKESNGKIHIDNAYEFLLQNTKNKEMKFFFEVILPKDINGKIEIVKPKKAFTVVPHIKKKKIVVLRTYDTLVSDDRHDTIIPITIKAYAIGHEDEIVVFRKSTFTYPRSDIIKAKQ